MWKTAKPPLHDYRDLDRRFHVACEEIARLCRSPAGSTPDGLTRIQTLLEQLPFTTEEFQLAMSRLGNARRYAESAEPRVASYEAKLLLGLVTRCRTAFSRLSISTVNL